MFSIYGKKAIFFFLFLSAPLYIALLIYHYGLTVPFWDQWELVPLLQKAYAGELSFMDIWTQHNEHRILFPLLLMLSLAYLTDWNIKCELYLNLVFAGLTIFFLYLLLHQIYSNNTPSWFLIILSFLIFSPSQWENWSWGWQIQILLSTLCTVISIWSVVHWQGQYKGIFIGIGAAVIASFSFNNGLFTWIVVIIMLFLKKERDRRHILIWTTTSFITFLLYYYKYQKPEYHPSLLFFIHHPYDFIRYVFAYLGSPLGFGNKYISIIIGLFSLIILCIGTIRIKRLSEEDFNILLPWLALASYAVLSAVATGIGRSGFGVGQALSSRYTTFSTLFIISGIVVVTTMTKNYLRSKKRLPLNWIVAISSISILFIISYTLTFSYGKKAFAARKEHIQSVTPYLKNIDAASEKSLQVLYPNASIVRERAKILLKMGLLKELK